MRREEATMSETAFWMLSDDVILNILSKLEDDPRHWARVACVSTRFYSLIRDICWKNKCSHSLPSSLLSDSPAAWASLHKLAVCCPGLLHSGVRSEPDPDTKPNGPRRAHLASGSWTLSREQGSKILGRQFRDDCLYICDWPGCVHLEEKRKYSLFRGVFQNFKRTRLWRTVNDRRKIDMDCAFCRCTQTWDLHSAFCLRRGFGFGYHDDGEPVVRAYVCENGHVSGAWTDVPMYS